MRLKPESRANGAKKMNKIEVKWNCCWCVGRCLLTSARSRSRRRPATHRHQPCTKCSPCWYVNFRLCIMTSPVILHVAQAVLYDRCVFMRKSFSVIVWQKLVLHSLAYRIHTGNTVYGVVCRNAWTSRRAIQKATALAVPKTNSSSRENSSTPLTGACRQVLYPRTSTHRRPRTKQCFITW